MELGTDGLGWASPIELSLPPNIQALAAGYAHSVALGADGTLWMMGDNSLGQLGRDDVLSSQIPLELVGLPRIRAIAAGAFHCLALDVDGQVWAWGDNSGGQLGDGTLGGYRAFPQRVPGLTRVKEVSGGYAHSLALNGDDELMAWGSDEQGQLGDGLAKSAQTHPVKTVTLSQPLSISAGQEHSLAVERQGTLFSWGGNSHGQLGYSSSGEDVSTPQPIPLP